MPYEIIGAKKDQTFDQRKRLFGPYPDYQKAMAESVAKGLSVRKDYLWIEVRYIKDDTNQTPNQS